MADEFELFRKRSYHGGYDHVQLCENSSGAQDDAKSVTFRVPPVKRSRSHPISNRAKAQREISPLSNRRAFQEKNIQPSEQQLPPSEFSLLCHRYGKCSPSAPRGVVKHVLHASFHSLVILPSTPCHICQSDSPPAQNGKQQHTRIITTPSPNAKRQTRSKRKMGVCEATTPIPASFAAVPNLHERTASLQPVSDRSTFNVTVLGNQGVGKATLIRTFATADDANNTVSENEHYASGANVSIMGEGRDDSLILTYETCQQFNERKSNADAFVIIYAVNDKNSYEEALKTLKTVRSTPSFSNVPIVIAANKGDIVRSRAVKTKDAHEAASKYRAKYVEVSALLNIHVDELFLGVLAQLHFARERKLKKISSDSNMVLYRKQPIASRAMGYIEKLLSRYRDCERDIENLFSPYFS